jgi:hypothetical protein
MLDAPPEKVTISKLEIEVGVLNSMVIYAGVRPVGAAQYPPVTPPVGEDASPVTIYPTV